MTDYTLAKWVEAKDCHDTTCHDDHPHLTYLDDAEFDRFIASVKAEALREAAENWRNNGWGHTAVTWLDDTSWHCSLPS